MHLREQYVTDRVVLTIQIQMLGSPDSFPLKQAWDDIEGPKDRWRTTAVSWCFMSYRVPIISPENSSERTTAWQMLIPFSKTDQNGDWSVFFCIFLAKKNGWIRSNLPDFAHPQAILPKSHWLLRHMAHHHHLIQQGIDFGPGKRCRKHQRGKLWLIPGPNMYRWSVWGTNHTKNVLCPILFCYILDCVKVCHIL